MTQRGEFIDVMLADGIGLRTSFDWREDRYAHRVTLIASSGQQRTVLESEEGTPDDRWPPSPAFQQLSWHGEGDRRVALLVGMAGKSHWSMSVEGSTSRRGIVFDVACRVNEAAKALGSTYRTLDDFADFRSNSQRIDGDGYAILLEADMPPNTQTLLNSGESLHVQCLAVESPPPYTARWKYSVTLA